MTNRIKKVVIGCAVAVATMSVAFKGQAEDKTYSFSVVPQQTASKTAEIWNPILTYLSDKTGYKFVLKTAKSIPVFEGRLAKQEPDFSYMNPYHYTHFHDAADYHALARAKDRVIKGIVVVRKDSPLKSLDELAGQEIAFPSAAAFAASVLPRGYLKANGIDITPQYVNSHDSVYLNVARGRLVAGGGIIRTFKNADAKVRESLRVLWTSNGYTPHAIAAHKRVSPEIVKAVQSALVALEETEDGKTMLGRMKIKGIMAAQDQDWDDVRALKLNEL